LSEPSLEDLEAERQEALALLAELAGELQAGAIGEEDYRALADVAIQRVGEATRRLEALASRPLEEVPKVEQDKSKKKKMQGRRRRPRWMLAVGALCFAAAAGVVVGSYVAPRLPGQALTGSVRLGSAEQVTVELEQARTLFSEGKLLEAAKLFGQVLDVQPNQPEALAYFGWITALSGASAGDRHAIELGRSYVSDAVRDAPSYADGHLFLGLILLRYERDVADAAIQFRLFLADHPSPSLRSASLAEIRQALREARINKQPG
jgi:tetratricopeptide (TPR) repeat protein